MIFEEAWLNWILTDTESFSRLEDVFYKSAFKLLKQFKLVLIVGELDESNVV